MKAERLLAELDRLRKDLDADPSDLEWQALHHAFCFISYQMPNFKAYVREENEKGSFSKIDTV